MLYNLLENINQRPQPFSCYTVETLWNDPHISKQMLKYHLDASVDIASYRFSFIDRSVEWITSHFSIRQGSAVCDFGCGPGLYTSRLALKGASVTGIDFSRKSIEYARDAALHSGADIRYIFQNYLEYESDEKYDLITLIMGDLCPLSPEQRRTLFRKFRRLLKENGAVLLDVSSLAAFAKKKEGASYGYRHLNGFWAEGEYYGFMNTFVYPEEKITLDQYTIVERERTWQVYNWLQYFSPETLSAELESNGLFIAEIYADLTGAPYDENGDWFAVVIKRK